VKVLVISNFYPPAHVGGYELACRDVVEKLAARGHEVRVLTSTYRRDSGGEEGVSRFLDFSTAGADSLGEKATRNLIYVKNFNTAQKIIEDFRPDLVYAWNMATIGISPVFAATERRLPVVFHLEDYWMFDLLKEKKLTLPQKILKLARSMLTTPGVPLTGFTCIAVSEALKGEYVARGIAPEGITVVHNALSDDIFEIDLAPAPPAEGFRIVYAGRLRENKGVDLLIRAAAKLREAGETDITVDIYGEGDFRDELRRTAHDLGCGGVTNFKGNVPREEILAAFAASSLVVVPSVWVEPFGLVVLEAMYAGALVLASDSGAPRELLDGGERGLVFESGSVESLCAQLRAVKHDRDAFLPLTENAKAYVRAHSRWDSKVDMIETVLRKAADT